MRDKIHTAKSLLRQLESILGQDKMLGNNMTKDLSRQDKMCNNKTALIENFQREIRIKKYLLQTHILKIYDPFLIN